MVFKIEKNKNYTVMSNFHLRDKELSFKAKGLLSFMLSLPDNWDYSLNGLVKVSKESKKAIRNILNELKENGYLVIEQTRGNRGYYKYNYIIYEEPIDKKIERDNPDTQKGYTEEGDAEKDTQINTNQTSTKETINKINKTTGEEEKSSSFFSEKHHSLTKDLIKRKYLEEDDIELGKYDKLFKKLLEDNSFDDIVSITHYVVSNVVKRNFKNEDNDIIENKFGYLKYSIENNIEKFKNKELIWDDDVGWFKDDNDFYDEIEK